MILRVHFRAFWLNLKLNLTSVLKRPSELNLRAFGLPCGRLDWLNFLRGLNLCLGLNLICGEAGVLARVSRSNLTFLAAAFKDSPSNLPQKSVANLLRGEFIGLKFTAIAKAAALGFRSIILRIAHR